MRERFILFSSLSLSLSLSHVLFFFAIGFYLKNTIAYTLTASMLRERQRKGEYYDTHTQ